MQNLKSIDPNQLVILPSLVAIAISEDLDTDEMIIVGGFLSAVGSALQIKASQIELQESQKDELTEIQQMEQQLEEKKKQYMEKYKSRC